MCARSREEDVTVRGVGYAVRLRLSGRGVVCACKSAAMMIDSDSDLPADISRPKPDAA